MCSIALDKLLRQLYLKRLNCCVTADDKIKLLVCTNPNISDKVTLLDTDVVKCLQGKAVKAMAFALDQP